MERLADDVCFHAGKVDEQRRTLVIFLHGLVQKGAGWQHNQQRAILRGAKRLGFSVITPRGRDGANRRGPDMVAWPTSAKAQRDHEASVLAEWKAAIAAIEKRNGEPFDEIFVVGFSNGAYYGSSLALRGGFEANGYAVFAGGAGYGAPTAKEDDRAPIFVGIAGKDGTAKDSRSLAHTLKKHRWPHRAETRPVGHTMADRHLDHALDYLRTRVDDERGEDSAKTGRASNGGS
jgi:predicted esterase